jgi:hypothetical protein
MISITKQNEINSQFVNIFRNVIEKNQINNLTLLNNLIEFEKREIDDKKTKNVIKIMLNIPYYENDKDVNDLRKFVIIKDKLQFIIDDNINKRLLNLRK